MICCPHCRRTFALVARATRPEVLIVQQVVALHYHVEPERLWLRDRRADAALARNVALYCLRRLTPLKACQIAEGFDRDRSDVGAATKAINNRRATEPTFDTEIKRLVHECVLALN